MSYNKENEGPSSSKLANLLYGGRRIRPKSLEGKIDEVTLVAALPEKINEVQQETLKQSSISQLLTGLRAAAAELFDHYMMAKINTTAGFLLPLK